MTLSVPVNAFGIFVIETPGEVLAGDFTRPTVVEDVCDSDTPDQTLADGGEVFFHGSVDDAMTLSSASLISFAKPTDPAQIFFYRTADEIATATADNAIVAASEPGALTLPGPGLAGLAAPAAPSGRRLTARPHSWRSASVRSARGFISTRPWGDSRMYNYTNPGRVTAVLGAAVLAGAMSLPAHAQRVSLNSIDAKIDTVDGKVDGVSGQVDDVLFEVIANGDGVFTINQDCAVKTGCGGPDTAGFPVNTTPGQSYRLTGDLNVPNADTTAVDLAGDATLDLNGFRILGPTSCSGTPITCTPTGSGIGVRANAGSRVFNGTVRGMGDSAVVTFLRDVRIEDLQLTSNGRSGIFGACENCQFIGNRVTQNGDSGIDFSFRDSRGTLVQGNSVSLNGGRGIRAAERGTVLDNVVRANESLGLQANEGAGGTAFGNNTFYDNNAAAPGTPQTAGGVEISPNVCNGNTICP